MVATAASCNDATAAAARGEVPREQVVVAAKVAQGQITPATEPAAAAAAAAAATCCPVAT